MKRFVYIAGVLFLAAIYFYSAKFGLALDAVSGFATLVWPPTGISLAALILFGYRFWPGIALGAFFANLSTGAPPLVAGGIAFGNTLEAVFGAYLLLRFAKFDASVQRLRDAFGLIGLAAFLSTLVSATIGVTSLWLGGIVSFSAYSKTWIAWWVGDMLGNLIVAPFILVWRSWRISWTLDYLRLLEGGAVVLLIAGVNILVFGSPNILIETQSFSYLLFLPLLWTAIRFGQPGTTLAVIVTSAAAILGTVNGFGPFVHLKLAESLFYLQIFMGMIAGTSLIVAAAVAERRKAILDLKEIEKLRMDFLTLTSHQLRTPLSGTKWLIETLQRKILGPLNKKQNEYLEHLYNINERMIKLVFDMLSVLRFESGAISIKKETISINDLYEELISMMLPMAKSKKIRFINALKGHAMATVNADFQMLRSILECFLSNAVIFSFPGQEVILNAKEEPDSIVFLIKDNGIGIPKDEQKRIFERFYRASNAKAFKPDGTGLGLHIAKMLSKKIGAEIYFESEEGGGTTFYLRVPKNKAINML